MTDQDKESLSAFMDGEHPDAPQVIDALKHDTDLQGAWQRYHLIRDTLHQRLAGATPADFAQQVARALEAEPTVIAPRRPRRALKQALKPAAGMAIAASIAVVAVLGVQTYQQPAQTLPQLAQSGDRVTASAPVAGVDRLEKRLDAASESKLSGYLVNHNEYSASAHVQGILPYTRIVSFTPGKRIED